MIKGKRIDAVCVAFNDVIEVCWAPLYSSCYGGDEVKVEPREGLEDQMELGVVLFKDTITIGEDEYNAILETQGEEPRRILRKVEFTDMKWEEEDEDE